MINIPDVLQNDDYSCGIYSVQSIMSYYGEDWLQPELAQEMHVSQEYGTQIKEITSFFKRQGLKVYTGEFTIQKLKHCINLGIPVILLIQAWDFSIEKDKWMNEEYGHYVIAIGYSDDSIIFEDPAMYGRDYLKFDELEARWHVEGDTEGQIVRNLGIAVWGRTPYNFNKPYHMEGKQNNMKTLKDILQEQVKGSSGDGFIPKTKNKKFNIILEYKKYPKETFDVVMEPREYKNEQSFLTSVLDDIPLYKIPYLLSMRVLQYFTTSSGQLPKYLNTPGNDKGHFKFK